MEREKLRVEKQARANSMRPGKWVNTMCKMCLHGCAIRVHVSENGIIDKIEGNPTCPDNLGKICVKGNTGIMRHYDPYRLKNPVKRTNPKKGPGEDPGWKEISWDEAFDIVAEKMKKCIDNDPREFLPAVSDFQRLFLWNWQLSLKCYNRFHVVGAYCGGAYHPTCGIYHSCFAGGGDYDYCNYWINCGCQDGFASHLHVAGSSKRMAKARQRGMKVVCIEPRLSTTAAKADEWIPIRPATDRHFVLGMIHSLMYEHKIYDEYFLKWSANGGYLIDDDGWFLRHPGEKYVVPEGRPAGSMLWFVQSREEMNKPYVWDSVDNCPKVFDDPTIKDIALEGAYTVNGKQCRPAFQFTKDAFKEYTPEWAAEITTVPADTIRRIAKEFGEAARIGSSITIEDEVYPFRPVSFNWYRGSQAHKYGVMDNMTFFMLQMLVGAFDVPGGHYGIPLTNVETDEPGPDGILDPKPHQLGPGVPWAWPPNTGHLWELFPMGGEPGHLHGPTTLEPEKYGLEFKPNTMLIYHCNPVWHMPGNSEEIWYKVMEKMDFIWAIDIIYNESTVWADIILPDHSYLESYTLYWGSEAPNTRGMTLRQPVTGPLYNTKDAFEILTEVCRRMGRLKDFNETINFLIGFVTVPELALKPDKPYSVEELYDLQCRFFSKRDMGEEHDLKWFKEHGHQVIEKGPKNYYKFSNKRGRDKRAPFYCEYIKKLGEELKERIKNVPGGLPFEWDYEEYVAIPTGVLSPSHTASPEYDMYAITFKEFQNYSESLSISYMRELVDREPMHQGILINTRTAEKKGIKRGDVIEVRSEFGFIRGIAMLTEGLHPEVIGVSTAVTRTVSHNPITRLGGGTFDTLLSCSPEYTDHVTGTFETTARVKVTRLSADTPLRDFPNPWETKKPISESVRRKQAPVF